MCGCESGLSHTLSCSLPIGTKCCNSTRGSNTLSQRCLAASAVNRKNKQLTEVVWMSLKDRQLLGTLTPKCPNRGLTVDTLLIWPTIKPTYTLIFTFQRCFLYVCIHDSSWSHYSIPSPKVILWFFFTAIDKRILGTIEKWMVIRSHCGCHFTQRIQWWSVVEFHQMGCKKRSLALECKKKKLSFISSHSLKL